MLVRELESWKGFAILTEYYKHYLLLLLSQIYIGEPTGNL